MVIYPSQGSKFTVTLQADSVDATTAAAYLRSRTFIRMKVEDPLLQTLVNFNVQVNGVHGSFNNMYYSDPVGILELPLRNFLNKAVANGDTTVQLAVNLYQTDGTFVDAWDIACDLYDGISYRENNMPRNKDAQQFLAAYSAAYILPPNVMLNPAQFGGVTANGIIVESNFHTAPTSPTWAQIAGGVSSTITPTGDRSNQIVVSAGADTLVVADATNSKKWKLEKVDYCFDLACIRWKSLTGATREHYFPVVSFIKGTDKQVSLVSPGDGYAVDKNAYNSVRCRLTGLTAYGYWYYMDLLQANDVHALIAPQAGLWNTIMSSEETRAFVEGSELATPEGNGFFNFEFTLKMKHYDTV